MKIIKGGKIDFVPASHEDPKNPGVLKRILAQKEDLLKGQVQMVNWAQMPVGGVFRAHYHEDMEEVFVMINGEAEIVIDGESAKLDPGDAVIIEPMKVHLMRNTGSTPVDYIVIGITQNKGGRTIILE